MNDDTRYKIVTYSMYGIMIILDIIVLCIYSPLNFLPLFIIMIMINLSVIFTYAIAIALIWGVDK